MEAKGMAAGVPYPGIMILDQKGTIRAKLFFDGHRDRTPPPTSLKLPAKSSERIDCRGAVRAEIM
jgi:hypothetical protein